MKTILDIQNLKIGYKGHVVSENVNFKLMSGELCAIVGINGIGKSTLLRTLGNLQTNLGGSMKLEERELSTYSVRDLSKKISLVLTEALGTKNLTVQELISIGRQPYTNWIGSLTPNDKKEIANALQGFDLMPLKDKKCHELSDGQLQRVLIARAMVQNTPLILLDEPTTHLDLAHKITIFKLLRNLAHENRKTILLTTHEIELAIQLADKILVLDGKENPFGEPCQLIENGSFSKLFPKDTVEFDAKTGTFRVKK